MQQLDINNAFLNGVLEDKIYMAQPFGFEDSVHPDYVCKLEKSLYGLKQAPRAWYDTLKKALINLGFEKCTSDFSLFFKKSAPGLLVVLVYVDDILVTGDDTGAVMAVITLLQQEFKLKHLGQVSYFLGIEVSCSNSEFHLCQRKHLLELLEKTNLLDCKPCSTPMAVNTKLSKYGGKAFSKPRLYRSIVAALQYLTLTRPDIAYCVNKLSQFLKDPSEDHWNSCKRLLRYLKGTVSLSLHFTPSSSSCMEAFSDADYAGCTDDRRSTGGHCVFFGSNLVVWSSKKQDVVSRSSAESEYRALANVTNDVIWLHFLCSELGISVAAPHQVWSDNSSAVALASNPVFHACTKHIEVDVHFIREKVASKFINVGHVSSSEQVADIFTKPLTRDSFEYLRSKLCLHDPG